MHTSAPGDHEAAVDHMLEIIRCHLGMDIAFVSSVGRGRRVFRHVAPAEAHPEVKVGASHALQATYCTLVIEGALQPLTPDTGAVPALAEMPVTDELGIGAYAGAPIRLTDGRVYGTLCAFSHDRHDFDAEDVHALELAAALIAQRLSGFAPRREDVAPLDGPPPRPAFEDPLRMLFQPVVDLRTGVEVGYEALARFPREAVNDPSSWFALAERLEVDAVLQGHAATSALAQLGSVPEGRWMAVNVSERALVDPAVRAILGDHPGQRILLELTEHASTRDQREVEGILAGLRCAGVRLALDDVGAGYSGLDRVLRLQPDVIKLDRSLVTGVWEDVRRQAMVQAFTTFARSTGVEVIAEGIETQEDADALRVLGVHMGQGFFLGRPSEAPWVDVI
ncbi:EAL domain-containing protein [Euzebya sp.]|uniref:sensor domain-containing phosphodiesterase n=1 Tax=Euzebya sp. TaxID=1971409 RepID=UPI0035185DEF